MMGRSKSTDKVRRAMAMVHPNAAAIDVGATMHVAAVRADRTPEPVRSFGTFTKDLHRLVDWFAECGVDTVVMESTSVYWIPIFELLDARGFAVFLVNARDAKHVPGRKTDVSDAEWLQRLHSYGLLRASFRPKGRIVELRAYLRQRERLLEYGASHIQHMQKALTEMNVQLHVLPDGFHRIRHYGLFASAARADNIARARQLLNAPTPQTQSYDAGATRPNEPPTLSHPCPCCGGRMIIIESFERGSTPRYQPTAPVIRIDTS